MNQDMIIEILSYCPILVVKKCRLLNKDINKRTCEVFFLKLNRERTNSVSGYFFEHTGFGRNDFFFIKDPRINGSGPEVSLDFLKPFGRLFTKACDTSNGILLCVNEGWAKKHEVKYIVCKPTTKQYFVIPKPETKYMITTNIGLMVIESYPLSYKIVRLSGMCNPFACQVFDSNLFAWKRLNNVELPEGDSLSPRFTNSVNSHGSLHWLTLKNNVFRFCFETETWSVIPAPEVVHIYNSPQLVGYGGKVGVISMKPLLHYEIHVLDSNENSWVKVKKGIAEIGFNLKPTGFLSRDVAFFVDSKQILLHDRSTGKCRGFNVNIQGSSDYFEFSMHFPFYSDYERVEFKESPEAVMKINCQ